MDRNIKKKSKSDILNESLQNNGIKASMALTRKSVYEAMEEYAKQENEANMEELEAATRVIDIIINSNDVEELVAMRDSLRSQIKG